MRFPAVLYTGIKNPRSTLLFIGSGYVPEKEYPTVSINAILVTILLRCSFYNLIVKKRPRVSLYSTECREKSPNQIDQLKRGYIDVNKKCIGVQGLEVFSIVDLVNKTARGLPSLYTMRPSDC